MSDIQYVMVMHDGSRATKFMSEDYCKDLMEQLAAAQSGEVCTKPHADDVLEFCQACKIESLQARLAEAERDSRRLQWLADNPRGAQIVVDGKTQDCVFWGISAHPRATLREAIDAAMGTTSREDASHE